MRLRQIVHQWLGGQKQHERQHRRDGHAAGAASCAQPEAAAGGAKFPDDLSSGFGIQGAADFSAQCRIGTVISRAGHRRLHLGMIRCQGLAFGAIFQMLFGFQRLRRIQLAVQIGLDEKALLASHASLPINFSRSNARPRASRDITVPMGAPVAAAISR